jgi:hypothetical protein
MIPYRGSSSGATSAGRKYPRTIAKLDRRSQDAHAKNWFEEMPPVLIDLPTYFKLHVSLVASPVEVAETLQQV